MRKARRLLELAVNLARWPVRKTHLLKFRYDRSRADAAAAVLEQSTTRRFAGTVLIDATWDNPHYWLRYALISKALGLQSADRVAILGQWRRTEQSSTLKRLGIHKTDEIDLPRPEDEQLKHEMTRKILALSSHHELLTLELPERVPASFFYDYLLKCQRRGEVDLHHPSLARDCGKFLDLISAAVRMLDRHDPRLVISSHAIGAWTPLVWIAAGRKVPVIVPFGDSGVARFWKIDDQKNFYNFVAILPFARLSLLSEAQLQKLREAGRKHFEQRFKGLIGAVGPDLAFGKPKQSITRDTLCARFGWDPHVKIVGVYASTWFDYPHSAGMSHFTDFTHWIKTTAQEARKNTRVNWLFKGHPTDALYGGWSIQTVLGDFAGQNVRIAEPDWKGDDLIEVLDAFVTYHGTVGVEAVYRRKPVMIADRGWYHDWDIARQAQSQRHYCELLQQAWWQDVDLDQAQKRAEILAGIYWGRPDWQERFLLKDDSIQWPLYEEILGLVKNSEHEIEREAESIYAWFTQSEIEHLNIYKNIRAQNYLA